MGTRTPIRALILGSGGFLGRGILEEDLDRYSALHVNELRDAADLTRFGDQIQAALHAAPGSALVNCIGARSGAPDLMHLLNAAIPQHLVAVAGRSSAQIIHIGSAAEIVQRVLPNVGPRVDSAASMSLYGDSKRAGTMACLSYSRAAVLRVYNLHGLPHQKEAGLHRLCLSVRATLAGEHTLESLVNTTRDYIDWQEVPRAVASALDAETTGLVEICSGFGVSMSEIVDALPGELKFRLREILVPPDIFASVIGPSSSEETLADRKSALIEVLAQEVLACASS